MSPRLMGTFAPDSPEWHAARAGGIGSSDIAAVLGLSPWESPFSLWHRKAGTIEPQATNDEMRRGHFLEPAVADWFASQHPEYVVRSTGSWCHERRDWQRANPDRLLCAAPRGRKPVALLEVKTDHESWKWGTPGTDEVPIYYRVQGMWQLDVMQQDVVFYAVLLGGLRFAEYRVEYNVAEAVELREMAREFLDSIEAGQAPDIDSSAQTYEVLRELNPEIDGTVDLDLPTAAEYIVARQNLAQAEAAEQRTKNAVAAAMGTAKAATCNGFTIATRQSKQGGRPFVVASRSLPDVTQLTPDAAA